MGPLNIEPFTLVRGRYLSTAMFGMSMLLLTSASQATETAEKPTNPCWQEISAEVDVNFEHRHFGRGEKLMPENMGAGVALFDANGDGRLDIYLLQGAPWPPSPPTAPGTKDTASTTPLREAQAVTSQSQSTPATAPNQLFLQGDDGTFVDGTVVSGLGDRGYAMGVTLADVDGDGHIDLYLTNFGPDVLYRNRGDGTFEDVTAARGLGLEGWSAGAAFLDLEGDGDVDLFVSRYLDFDPSTHKWCGNARRQLRSYCHPDIYPGASDRLYRNRGDGRFDDISQVAGLRPGAKAKGLGVLTYDLDGDGHQDVYVANDSTMNHFYRGDGQGIVHEEALLYGLGFNGSGAAEASMGVAYGDVDGQGDGELFLTHLDQETNTLYRGSGGSFEDSTRRAGLDRPSLPWVGFGTALVDIEHDGDLDLLVANGHIIDNIALFDSSRSHRQPMQWLLNDGRGRFQDASSRLGLSAPLVGRGLAVGDLDDDGDLDAVVTQNGDRALVLRNDCPVPNSSLRVQLRGQKTNVDALGARVELKRDDTTLVRYVTGGGSYLSHSASDVHFGLGHPAQPRADGETNHIAVKDSKHQVSAEDKDTVPESWQLRVYWPDGTLQEHLGLRAGATYEVIEGSRSLQRRPFSGQPSGREHVSTHR